MKTEADNRRVCDREEQRNDQLAEERAITVARTQGQLERACMGIAAAMDAGVTPTDLEREASALLLIELCIVHGRALNARRS